MSSSDPDRPSQPAPRTSLRRPVRPVDDWGSIVSILGGSNRKGSWEPPARLRVLSVLGGVDLDFREADLLEGETVVEVLSIMGGVNIVVPPDVDVSTAGVGILGGFGSVSHHAQEDDVPRLVIRGLALLGGVDVKVKKRPWKKRLLPE